MLAAAAAATFTRVRYTILLVVLTSACAPALRAPAPVPEARFYQGRTYGSEAQFNPLSQFLNEGFDMLRVEQWDRRVIALLPSYREAAHRVLNSVGHPDRTAVHYGGWDRLLKNEILPLTFTRADGGGAWVPNYQFHLLGSGMASARLTEWFQQHDAPYPALQSFLVMTASHLMNEVVENQKTPGDYSYDPDAMVDLLLFDPAGFLLFRSARVQRLFSGPLQLTNWPAQPAWVEPGGTLENTGQLFIMRAAVPGLERWRLLYGFGTTTLFGASRDVGGGLALSAAVGMDAVDVVYADDDKSARTVRLRPAGGVFLDREGSLLASIRVAPGGEGVAYGSDAALHLNVYPGLASIHGINSPGIWVQALREGGVRVGLVTRLGLGLGWWSNPR